MEYKLIFELFKDQSKYKVLLNALKKYSSNDNRQLPYQKELLKTLHMSRCRLLELMQELYENFSDKMCEPKAYVITDTRIYLYVLTNDEDVWYIGVDDLKLIPRKGEEVVLFFIRDSLGYCYFHVEEVRHEIESGIHTITVYLSENSTIKAE